MGIKYFVVDARPVEHFSKGHLQHSLHLDANLVRLVSVVAMYVRTYVCNSPRVKQQHILKISCHCTCDVRTYC